MTNYSIFSRPEYFSELVRQINATKAGDSIAISAMDFEPTEPSVKKILEALYKAAGRGAKINLIIDAYSFLAKRNMFVPGPLFWHSNLPDNLSKYHSQKQHALQKLKDAGGNYTITNRPTHRLSPPFKGRSHIKFAFFNDYVFIGNCNLDKDDYVDLMVGFTDPKVASWLADFSQKLQKDSSVQHALGSKNDLSIKLTPKLEMLLDSGQPGQSLIFETALKLIDSAKESIVFACQYFPDKKVLEHLVEAHKRGVEIKLIYNHPLNRAPVLAAVHYLNKTKGRLSLPGFLFANQQPKNAPYLHAKLLASERSVMIGSHNFVEAGVKFGTAELVLNANDPLFSKRAVQKLTDLLS